MPCGEVDTAHKLHNATFHSAIDWPHPSESPCVLLSSDSFCRQVDWSLGTDYYKNDGNLYVH